MQCIFQYWTWKGRKKVNLKTATHFFLSSCRELHSVWCSWRPRSGGGPIMSNRGRNFLTNLITIYILSQYFPTTHSQRSDEGGGRARSIYKQSFWLLACFTLKSQSSQNQSPSPQSQIQNGIWADGCSSMDNGHGQGSTHRTLILWLNTSGT